MATYPSPFDLVLVMYLCLAHAPSLKYHLLSLRAVADKGHTYTGNHEGATVFFSTGETLFFSSVGKLNFLYAYRPGMLVDETASATIAPGPTPGNRDTPVGTNYFHVAHAYAHEGALRKTDKQMGVTTKGKLHECKGCSMAKGIRMSGPSKMNSREGSKPSVVGEANESGQDRETEAAAPITSGGLQHLLQEPGAANAGFP